MRIIAVFFCSATLLGCSSISPSVESSTPRSVVIEAGSLYGKEAAELAEYECQSYERHAQLRSDKQDLIGWIWTYDCVE